MLAAMGVAPEIAGGFLRISFGPATSEADVDAFLAEWRRIAAPAARGMIYLDYQATTPVAPEVAAAMRPVDRGEIRQSAQPVALGPRGGGGDRGRARPGRAARSASTAAASPSPRARPRRSTGRSRARSSESKRPQAGRPSRPSMPRCSTRAEWLEGQGVEVVRLPVGADGLIDLDMAEAAIDDEVALVAVMLVNNEIGVIQPVAEIARMAHEAGALMLCDAVQGLRAGADPRRARPGRRLGPQDPRPQGRRRPVDARRRRARAACSTAAGRSRACARERCRRRCASASARRRELAGRAARRRRRSMLSKLCRDRARNASGQAG